MFQRNLMPPYLVSTQKMQVAGSSALFLPIYHTARHRTVEGPNVDKKHME
jgi:hypothetical protein